MAKTKVLKSGSFPMTKGGSGHMSDQNHAGPQTPGQSSSMGLKKSAGIAKGGSGHMFPQQHAIKAKAGHSGKGSGK